MTDGPLDRVLRKVGGPATLDLLVDLPGADLTTLLLAVTSRRAEKLTAADVIRRRTEDRFVAPGSVGLDRLREAESAVLAAVPAGFERVVLSPLAPLGLCSALGPVHQNKVIGTIRGNEVAADPTNGLALEAAVRRRSSAEPVRLATVQRVVRAQQFGGPRSVPHFSLLALVTAGRDPGDLGFERAVAGEQIGALTDAVRRRLKIPVQARLTVLDPRFAAVVEAVRADLPEEVEVVEDPDRPSGHNYYTGLCFKIFGRADGEWVEFGDGGFVTWTRDLLGNRKERLLIGGLGVDRLA